MSKTLNKLPYMYMAYVNVPSWPWLQFLCSYVFYPVAFLMGVAEEDCFEVAKLIGDKTFINEFYAYTRLSVYIKNRENLTWYGHVSFIKIQKSITLSFNNSIFYYEMIMHGSFCFSWWHVGTSCFQHRIHRLRETGIFPGTILCMKILTIL